MKIGYIIYNNGSYGGAEKRIANIVNWLAQNYTRHQFFLFISDRMFQWLKSQDIVINDNVKVDFYHDMKNINKSTYNANRSINSIPKEKKVSVTRGLIYKLKYIRAVYRNYLLFKDWALRNNVQIIQGWHGSGDAMLLLRLFNRRKIIYSIVSASAKIGTPLKWIGNFSFKSIFIFAHRIDFLSEEILTKYKSLGVKINQKKTRIAPCSFINYNKTYIAEKEKLVSFSAARFENVKNAPLVVKVANVLINEFKIHIRFILMGGKGEEPFVHELIREYKLEDFVSVQYEKNVENILSRSMIYLALGQNNNYPSQALLEAMACGCAIIATDVGETRKMIDESVGFLITHDAYQIAEKIKYLIENHLQAEKLGRQARAKAIKENTIEKYSNYLMEIYNSL
jgi:glycosyltransferase involved in cell wall biosynthesis